MNNEIVIDFKESVINKVYLPYLCSLTKLEIYYGGAGSGKSVFVAQKIIYNMLSNIGMNVLAIRKVGATCRDSIWAELKKIINDWNLKELFKVNETNMRLTCINGNGLICKGLDDNVKLKSITFDSGILTHIWCEEATELKQEDYMQLSLRLRGKSKIKKQIFMSFNPISHLHWIKKAFFDIKQEGVTILKSTYLDNDFLETEDKAAIEKIKDLDYVYYQIYGLGEWGVLGNLIFNNYVIEDFSYKEEDFDDVYYGMDFGFNHPSAFIKVGFKDNEMYIFYEYYKKEKTNTDLINEIEVTERNKNKPITADSAEPDRIMEFNRSGILMLASKKGADSVRHGIDFIKRYRVHIHTRCNNTAAEFQLYKYKEDKDGNVIDEPISLNDDAIAAIRYAIEPKRLMMMKARAIKLRNIL